MVAASSRDDAIIVKPSGPFDLGRLSQLHKSCFDDGWSRSDLAHLLAMPGSFALIARIVGGHFNSLESLRGIGFSVCRIVRDECELLSIGVLPVYRGRNVARKMLRECMCRCFASGARKMFLEVSIENVPARSLYFQHGFQQVGIRKDYYQLSNGARQDAMTLKCELNETLTGTSEEIGAE